MLPPASSLTVPKARGRSRFSKALPAVPNADAADSSDDDLPMSTPPETPFGTGRGMLPPAAPAPTTKSSASTLVPPRPINTKIAAAAAINDDNDIPAPPTPLHDDDPRVPIQLTPLPPLPIAKSRQAPAAAGATSSNANSSRPAVTSPALTFTTAAASPSLTSPASPPPTSPPKMAIRRRPIGAANIQNILAKPSHSEDEDLDARRWREAILAIGQESSSSTLGSIGRDPTPPTLAQVTQQGDRQEATTREVSNDHLEAPLPPVPPRSNNRTRTPLQTELQDSQAKEEVKGREEDHDYSTRPPRISKPPQLKPLSWIDHPQPFQLSMKSPSESLSSILSAYSRSSTASVVRSSDGTAYSANESPSREGDDEILGQGQKPLPFSKEPVSEVSVNKELPALASSDKELPPLNSEKKLPPIDTSVASVPPSAPAVTPAAVPTPTTTTTTTTSNITSPNSGSTNTPTVAAKKLPALNIKRKPTPNQKVLAAVAALEQNKSDAPPSLPPKDEGNTSPVRPPVPSKDEGVTSPSSSTGSATTATATVATAAVATAVASSSAAASTTASPSESRSTTPTSAKRRGEIWRRRSNSSREIVGLRLGHYSHGSTASTSSVDSAATQRAPPPPPAKDETANAPSSNHSHQPSTSSTLRSSPLSVDEVAPAPPSKDAPDADTEKSRYRDITPIMGHASSKLQHIKSKFHISRGSKDTTPSSTRSSQSEQAQQQAPQTQQTQTQQQTLPTPMSAPAPAPASAFSPPVALTPTSAPANRRPPTPEYRRDDKAPPAHQVPVANVASPASSPEASDAEGPAPTPALALPPRSGTPSGDAPRAGTPTQPGRLRTAGPPLTGPPRSNLPELPSPGMVPPPLVRPSSAQSGRASPSHAMYGPEYGPPRQGARMRPPPPPSMSGRSSPALTDWGVPPSRGRQPGPGPGPPPGAFRSSSRASSARPSSRGSMRPGPGPGHARGMSLSRPTSEVRWVQSPTTGEMLYRGRDGTLYPEMREPTSPPDPKALKFPMPGREVGQPAEERDPSSALAGTVFQPAPLAASHFHCYQRHAAMLRRQNRRYPLACQTCGRADREDRFSCGFCHLRICEGCLAVFEDKGRDLQGTVEELAKGGQEGRERSMSLNSPTRSGEALGLEI